jgi:hypothetical protein
LVLQLLFLIALLVAGAHADILFASPGALTVGAPSIANTDYDSNPEYSFTYRVTDVETGDSKAQEETRKGDTVEGSYIILEPDGWTRTVRYFSDPVNGFNVIVERNRGKGPIISGFPSSKRPAHTTTPKPATTARPVAPPLFSRSSSDAKATKLLLDSSSDLIRTSFTAPHASYSY